MLFLDGVYVDRLDGSARFRWVSSPATQELTQLSQTIARRVGRYLERQGLLERDADDCMDAGGRAPQGAVAENSYLTSDAVTGGPIDQLLGHSITYRIAVGPQGIKAQRLKRVFNIDITTCETCGGVVRVIASIEDLA
jgi:hypothetical protein